MTKYRPAEPWKHTEVRCDGCRVNPIEGYRYKYVQSDYDLCGKCFKKEVPAEEAGQYLKIARRTGCPPFQVTLIECDACGAAPIRGTRYQNKQELEAESEGGRGTTLATLCESCFQEQDEEARRNWDEGSNPSSHNSKFQDYHITCMFYWTCGRCQAHPIQTPAYRKVFSDGSIEETYCFSCFDELKRYEDLDDSKWNEIRGHLLHYTQLGCHECGSNPIIGTAFSHPSKPEETICLTCHYNKDEEVQNEYTVIEAPPTLRGALKLAAVQARADSTSAGGTDPPQQLKSLQEQQLRNQLEMVQLQNLVSLSAASASMMARW